MSEADKMFEELGYKKSFGTGYIFYNQKNGVNNQYGFEFNLRNEEVYPYCDETANDTAIYITMQELKAINRKCKELGWI